ncbi:hypothetical protein RND81_11G237800 [Saponaria officinalis]|uniref:Uncharacterized protein n=1 Tax=Saponaria officinalis TaxID=3572 RepID=A0AAW1HQX2_SAPOF
MHQQVTRREDVGEQELNEVKAELSAMQRDRNRAFEEVKEIKLRLSKISGENNEELSRLKASLQSTSKELKSKEKTIESLQAEVKKAKQFELGSLKKDDELKMMKEQLSHSEASVSQKEALSSDSKKMMEELQMEVEKRKISEAKLFDSFVKQTNQLQEASFMIEKHRLEAASLREKLEALEEEKRHQDEVSRELVEKLRNEVMVVKEGGKCATIETKTLLNEIDFLKNELKQAMEAEENKDKALEDLALALKEVAAESKLAKEKLISTEQLVEAVKEEASNLKKMVKCTEGTYDALLQEQKRETDRLTNIVSRLKLEAEESLLSWSRKEIEFVKCIKKVEDEKNAVQVENTKLTKWMRESKGMNENLNEETKNLRDILNQALNEANVADEGKRQARMENACLKDFIAEKDKALVSLAQETERLRISEAEATESIKQLKRVMSLGSKKAAKKEVVGVDTPERKLTSTFSFDRNQMWPSIPAMTTKSSKDLDEDPPVEEDALAGSIFDLVESPIKDPPLPYHRRTSSACSSTDDRTSLTFENYDDDAAHFDDMEIESSSQGKKKALLKRFGDLLRRKNSHPPKDLPHPPKEVAHSLKEIAA